VSVRVLHVHRIAGVGGSERHLLTLLPELRATGIEPLFVGLDDPSGDPEPFYRELEARGVPFRRLPCRRDVEPLLPLRLAQVVRGLRPALLHTHLVHGDVYGAAAAGMLRLPFVATKHNDDPFKLGPFRHVERLLARRARTVIAITGALARFYVDRIGVPESKVEVIHYGLDELPEPWGANPAVDLPAGSRVVLAVSRLVDQKGLETAVAALPTIRERHPRAYLLVLGEGPLRRRLVDQAAALGVADALVLPGRAGDVAAWLRAADVFVHPARWEGFGLVLLEAMLAELPVVATRVSAIPEIVADGETGLLVGPGDVPALAKAVTSVLDDPKLAARLGQAGRRRVHESFGVERMARETAAVYERALSSTRSAQLSTE
jgi:glycosyltransferase involved in cell wall biosynthesis